MKILILGANGMLGHTLFLKFSENLKFQIYGSLRSKEFQKYFPRVLHNRLIYNIDAKNPKKIEEIINEVKPELIINCIGMIKQKPDSHKIQEMYEINSKLPNILSIICNIRKIRMIHLSTDCVFKGDLGNYSELSKTDAVDEYGKSKLEGEITDQENVITLRTSIVGHEINSHYSLLEWFLSQDKEVIGYKKAIFSGLTTLELFNIINNYIIKDKNLYGLFHVGGEPIDKFSFLKLVAKLYKKEINIIPYDEPKIDRSLDSSLFLEKTGYVKQSWYKMLDDLNKFFGS